eukprot:s5656_g1.t1
MEEPATLLVHRRRRAGSWSENAPRKAIFTYGMKEKGSRHLGYTWSALAIFTHDVDEQGYCYAIFLVVIPQLAARRRIIGIQWYTYFACWSVYQCSGPRACNLLCYHLVGDMAYWYTTVLEVIPWPSLRSILQTSWTETVVQKAVFTHDMDEKGSRHFGYTWSALVSICDRCSARAPLPISLQTAWFETAMQKAIFTHDMNENGSRHLGYMLGQHWSELACR